MILFLILTRVFLISGVHQNWDRRAFNNILGLLCTIKTQSDVHSLSFLAHFLRHAQNYGMSVHNFICA
jgi:hypothetical protein